MFEPLTTVRRNGDLGAIWGIAHCDDPIYDVRVTRDGRVSWERWRHSEVEKVADAPFAFDEAGRPPERVQPMIRAAATGRGRR